MDLTALLNALPANLQAQLKGFLGQTLLDFVRVPGRLAAIEQGAQALQASANQANDTQRAAAATALESAAMQLQGAYAAASDQVAQLIAVAQSNTADSTTLASMGVQAAASVGTVLASVSALEQQAKNLGAGAATGAPIPWGKYIVYGGLLYLALWAFLRPRGNRQYVRYLW